MYIITETGVLLEQYSKWDLGSIPMAYQWITEHGYQIMSVQSIMGNYYIIVR